MQQNNSRPITAEYLAELMRQESQNIKQEGVKNTAPSTPTDPPTSETDNRQIIWLPIDLPQNYPSKHHPFRPASPDRLDALKQSISENGIINPIVIWERYDGSYIILAGHNRRTAAKLLGWPKIPCTILYGLEESDAAAIMLADNLQQREDLLPSERAKAYKMQLDIRRRQGRRTDLTCGHLGHKWSRDEISDTDSGRTVQRYIRLNYLIPELLEKVDTNALGIAKAEQLSFISRMGQKVIYTYFFVDKPRGKLDKKLIQSLRQLDSDPDKILDAAAIDALFLAREENHNFRSVKVPMKEIRQFFPPDITEQEVVERLLEALNEKYIGGENETSRQAPAAKKQML